MCALCSPPPSPFPLQSIPSIGICGAREYPGDLGSQRGCGRVAESLGAGFLGRLEEAAARQRLRRQKRRVLSIGRARFFCVCVCVLMTLPMRGWEGWSYC